MFFKLLAGPVLLWALTTSFAVADEGHDHDAAPAAKAGPALARFTASAERFELVGIADGQRLTVYLDRFDDNAPVAAATVDLEIAGTRIPLKEHEAGEFEGTLAEPLGPGHTPVTATVLVAGGQSESLSGEFDVHEEEHEGHASTPRWKQWGALVAALAAALGAAVFLVRRAQARQTHAGGAA